MRRLLAVFAVTGVMMVLIFRFADWYADNSALPRYCSDPQATIGHVKAILSNPDPIGQEKRRSVIVAAKLIFLVPQADAEPLEDYLHRLGVVIAEKCRLSY